jgi:hypothetical protein
VLSRDDRLVFGGDLVPSCDAVVVVFASIDIERPDAGHSAHRQADQVLMPGPGPPFLDLYRVAGRLVERSSSWDAILEFPGRIGITFRDRRLTGGERKYREAMCRIGQRGIEHLA